MMSERSEVTIEKGSTNVYADLGYADATEMQRMSQLAREISGSAQSWLVAGQKKSASSALFFID